MMVHPLPLPETHAPNPARSRRRTAAQKAQPHGDQHLYPRRAVADFVSPAGVDAVPWIGDILGQRGARAPQRRSRVQQQGPIPRPPEQGLRRGRTRA